MRTAEQLLAIVVAKRIVGETTDGLVAFLRKLKHLVESVITAAILSNPVRRVRGLECTYTGIQGDHASLLIPPELACQSFGLLQLGLVGGILAGYSHVGAAVGRR